MAIEHIMDPALSRIPEGKLADKWTNYKAHQKLVNPANKRKLDIIVVGSGLAGGAAAATLGEMGFKVKCSAFRILLVVLTPSLHRAVSTLPRTIRTTVTRSIVCSTTPSRAVTTVLVRPTSIVWLRYRTTSSTSA